MKVKVLEPKIIVHDVPFEKIVCDNRDGNKLFVEFDDENETRYKISFIDYIALKVTAEDCFDGNIFSNLQYSGMMYELSDSEWITQLKNNSNYTEPSTRRFRHIMDNMFHYIIGLGDYYVEIVASGYKLRKLSEEESE